MARRQTSQKPPFGESLAAISQEIIELQKPLRILDSISWDSGVEEFLKRTRFRELPELGPERYQAHKPLGFSLPTLNQNAVLIENRIRALLGSASDLSRLLLGIVDEYRRVGELLAARGMRRFGEISRSLYGSPHDAFFPGDRSVLDLSHLLSGIFRSALGTQLPGSAANAGRGCDPDTEYSDRQAVRLLQKRLNQSMGVGRVTVELSNGIIADASAGGTTIKLKRGARYSNSEIELLEVHEGWVHAGTTWNGRQQKWAKFLRLGSPRVASTQEGLATVMEIFSFRATPERARRINDRVRWIALALQGANLLELIEQMRVEGYSEEDALFSAQRVYRGTDVRGGAAFTKDIAYCRGFVEIYNFMRTCVRAGRQDLLPLLFSGKIRVTEIPLIAQMADEGWVNAPRFLPEPFATRRGIVVWMAFSNFLNRLDLSAIQEHNNQEFEKKWTTGFSVKKREINP